jgi:hypothetical protein
LQHNLAEESASAIYKMFLDYRQASDFVGMDMARKFLQMGYTRARRYANHASGKKYEANPQKESTKERKRRRANASDRRKKIGAQAKRLKPPESFTATTLKPAKMKHTSG